MEEKKTRFENFLSLENSFFGIATVPRIRFTSRHCSIAQHKHNNLQEKERR